MDFNQELIDNFKFFLQKKDRSAYTITAYSKDITQLSNYIKINFNKVNEKHIKNFLKQLEEKEKVTKKTLSRKLNSINTFYKFLKSENLILFNPSKSIEHPKYKHKQQRFLKKSEFNNLRQTARSNKRLYTMIELLLQTGMRISELSNLMLKEVDLIKREIKISSKTTSVRIIPLNDKIYFILKDYLEYTNLSNKESPFFKTKNNKKIQVRNIRSAIDKAMINAKIKNACVNDLRNTFIVEQLSAGVSLDKVASIVGHKNLNSTKRYLECLPKKYKEIETLEIVEL